MTSNSPSGFLSHILISPSSLCPACAHSTYMAESSIELSSFCPRSFLRGLPFLVNEQKIGQLAVQPEAGKILEASRIRDIEQREAHEKNISAAWPFLPLVSAYMGVRQCHPRSRGQWRRRAMFNVNIQKEKDK